MRKGTTTAGQPKPQPLRSLEETRADIETLEREAEGLFGKITNPSASADEVADARSDEKATR